MELHSRVFKVALAAAVGLFAAMGSQEDSKASEYRYLCTSVPGSCEYAPKTAPALQADVCRDAVTGTVTLKGAGDCPSGTWPYYVENGEVIDPQTNEIQAYVPLDDGCDLGYCEVKPIDAGPTQPGAMCCSESGCTATTGECGTNDTLLWCFDGEEPVQQGGEWVCYEPEE